VPREIDIRPALPLNTVGKTLYRVLREESGNKERG
jgi:acyl-CoA synthetase (AMP-forming)/AMP-acid ligase II